MLGKEGEIFSHLPSTTNAYELIPFIDQKGNCVIAILFSNGSIQLTQSCGEALLKEVKDSGRTIPKAALPKTTEKKCVYHGKGPW